MNAGREIIARCRENRCNCRKLKDWARASAIDDTTTREQRKYGIHSKMERNGNGNASTIKLSFS